MTLPSGCYDVMGCFLGSYYVFITVLARGCYSVTTLSLCDCCLVQGVAMMQGVFFCVRGDSGLRAELVNCGYCRLVGCHGDVMWFC